MTQRFFDNLDVSAKLLVAETYTNETGDNTNIAEGLNDEAVKWLEKVLLLDEKTWRCGSMGENKVGFGNTELLNTEGYMCCLGQFSLQLCDEVSAHDLVNNQEPHETEILIPMLVTKFRMGEYQNSMLSGSAIKINDEPYITTPERVEDLKKLFFARGYTIIFKSK